MQNKAEVKIYSKSQEEASGFRLTTEEKYKVKRRRQYLILECYATEIKTGKRHLLSSIPIKLPKNVPLYITEKELWKHTDWELHQLEIIMKRRGEKVPTEQTIKDWKYAIKG